MPLHLYTTRIEGRHEADIATIACRDLWCHLCRPLCHRAQVRTMMMHTELQRTWWRSIKLYNILFRWAPLLNVCVCVCVCLTYFLYNFPYEVIPKTEIAVLLAYVWLDEYVSRIHTNTHRNCISLTVWPHAIFTMRIVLTSRALAKWQNSGSRAWSSLKTSTHLPCCRVQSSYRSAAQNQKIQAKKSKLEYMNVYLGRQLRDRNGAHTLFGWHFYFDKLERKTFFFSPGIFFIRVIAIASSCCIAFNGVQASKCKRKQQQTRKNKNKKRISVNAERRVKPSRFNAANWIVRMFHLKKKIKNRFDLFGWNKVDVNGDGITLKWVQRMHQPFFSILQCSNGHANIIISDEHYLAHQWTETNWTRTRQ